MELNIPQSSDNVELVQDFNKAMQNYIHTANEICYCKKKIEGAEMSIAELEKEKQSYITAISECEKRQSEYNRAIEYVEKKYSGEEKSTLKVQITLQIESLNDSQEGYKAAVEKTTELLSVRQAVLEEQQAKLVVLEQRYKNDILAFHNASKDLQEYTGIDLYAEFIKSKFVEKSDSGAVFVCDFKLHFAGEEAYEYE